MNYEALDNALKQQTHLLWKRSVCISISTNILALFTRDNKLKCNTLNNVKLYNTNQTMFLNK